MKVYYDGLWNIERENGGSITLTWNESSLLYDQMLRAAVWSEVEIRFPDNDVEFQEQFGCSREEIEAAKESIVEHLLPEVQDINEDMVYNAIGRWT